MGKRGACFFLALCVMAGGVVYAQDFGFGFGDDDTAGDVGTAGRSLSVSVGGEVSASFVGYIDDFKEGLDDTRLGDIFSGKLNFSASTSFAEGVINLKLSPAVSPSGIFPDSPVNIDEGYVRAFFGNFDITAGLRKLTWGKADSFGPLDVINPLDYSAVFTEMADNISLMGIRIARPLVHASFRFGQFSKIEGVFIPWFKPHYIPEDGKWAPAQMEMLESVRGILKEPDTTTIRYAQMGLRFTTTFGPADFGAQYYYGRLPEPSVKLTLNPGFLPLADLLYNRYHQIGLDYAQVLFGFNLRAEFAANITDDLAGDDGAVYNPSIAWSFGFDRDLVWGINLNLQVNESIRLLHDKLGSGAMMGDMTGLMTAFMTGTLDTSTLDIEGDSRLTSSRLTVALSKKFLRDELEVRTAVAWGIEDSDAAIMPAIIWTKDDIRFALSGGFFVGESDGQIGQFKDNHFLKISMTYTF